MNNKSGLIQVKMAIAYHLRGRRIVMIPLGSASAFSLQTLDINDILRQTGLIKAKQRESLLLGRRPAVLRTVYSHSY
jgi:hypothetical protein